MEVNGKRHAPAALASEKAFPPNHWIGGVSRSRRLVEA
jgi:hypothetical protein